MAPATQNQALTALLFLYGRVLGQDLPWLDKLVRAKRPKRLPVVLTQAEVRAVLEELSGLPRLIATLLYGSGLRLLECLRLRTKDIDFARHTITVRAGKGNKDRITVLPRALAPPLTDQMETVRLQHNSDLRRGAGWVELPHSLGRKSPDAGRAWPWQWVFPATRTYRHPDTGQRRRHHLHESVMQRAMATAVRSSGINKRATCHSLRYSFATHLLLNAYDIRTVQQLLGHKDIRTTMVHTQVALDLRGGIRSPADRLVETALLLPEDRTISRALSQPIAQLGSCIANEDLNDDD